MEDIGYLRQEVSGGGPRETAELELKEAWAGGLALSPLPPPRAQAPELNSSFMNTQRTCVAGPPEQGGEGLLDLRDQPWTGHRVAKAAAAPAPVLVGLAWSGVACRLSVGLCRVRS